MEQSLVDIVDCVHVEEAPLQVLLARSEYDKVRAGVCIVLVQI
jgi:hypothetical protein